MNNLNELLQLQLNHYRAFSAYWYTLLNIKQDITLEQAKNRLEQECPSIVPVDKIGR